MIPNQLVFNPTNWSSPQPVSVVAVPIPDRSTSSPTLTTIVNGEPSRFGRRCASSLVAAGFHLEMKAHLLLQLGEDHVPLAVEEEAEPVDVLVRDRLIERISAEAIMTAARRALIVTS